MLNLIPKTIKRRNRNIQIIRFVIFSMLYISFILLIINIVLFVIYTENKAQIFMINSAQITLLGSEKNMSNINPDDVFSTLEFVKNKKERFKSEYINRVFKLLDGYSKDIQIRDVEVMFKPKFTEIHITGITAKRDLLITMLEHIKNTDKVINASVPLSSLIAVENGLKFALNITFSYE